MVPQAKTLWLVQGDSCASSATVTGAIDRLGYEYAIVTIGARLTAAHTAGTNAYLALAITQGTGSTGGTAITELTGGTASGNFSLSTPGIATTATNTPSHQFSIDLRGRHRYLSLTATPPTTMIVSAWCTLHNGELLPVSAAKQGVTIAVGV